MVRTLVEILEPTEGRVYDPFTGTGTFIVRLLQSDIINTHDLARKYVSELHANEIMLLAYYVAAINTEATYHGVMGGEYTPFEGIVLADTFQMTEDGGTLGTKLFTHNNDRAVRQLNNPIQVIIGKRWLSLLIRDNGVRRLLAAPEPGESGEDNVLADERYDVLGPKGSDLYVLPQAQQPRRVWPGLSSEGLDRVKYREGATMTLTPVSAPEVGK